MTPQRNMRPASRFRFSLKSMMLLMLVCSVTAAGGYYMMEANRKGASTRSIFVIFTLAAPVVLLMTMSLFRFLQIQLNRFNRRTRRPESDVEVDPFRPE